MTTNTDIPKPDLNDYLDIINYERPHAKHPMSITSRAAQFAPYAALVGHKDIVAHNEARARTKVDIDHDIIIEYDE